MHRTFRVLHTAFLLTALCALSLAQEQPDPVALLRKSSENHQVNEKKVRDYMYRQRLVLHKNGPDDKPEITTSEVFVLSGEEVERLIEKDDKPLPEKDAKKEEERIAKIYHKRETESPEERRKREEKFNEKQEESRKYEQEIADAFDVKLVGMDEVQGRPAWVVTGEPKPGYKPKQKEAAILQKFRFKAWIDRDAIQLSRLEAEAIDGFSFGWLLARVSKGAVFSLEQTRVNDEVWLPQHLTLRAGARLMLVKKFDVNLDITYSDYRKFRTEAKITGVVDPQAPPPPPQP